MTDLWTDYVDAFPERAEEAPARGPFGDSPELADELLALVLAGGKRATSGPPDPAEPVTVGNHWVVTDGNDRERVVLRTTEVRAGRLDSVDEQFAADEGWGYLPARSGAECSGAGDLSRAYWLREHRAFVRRVLGRSTTADVDDVEMIFERFRVVWPPEHADAPA